MYFAGFFFDGFGAVRREGFSLIEILSPCPVYWRMNSVDSLKFIDEQMSKTFPLGIFKDWDSQN